MPEENKANQREKPADRTAFNYCVSFLDLLGQRDVLRGQGLLPKFNSEDEKKEFYSVIRDSIGAILRLQQQAETILEGILEKRADSPLRGQLSPDEQKEWDEMQMARVITQRWSDGLVSFVCLGDQEVKCPMNGVFGIFALAGSICLLGLAGHRPVRGAIDIAWGVELRPGELYGPVVARAYELESEFSQYPRIVVSPQVIQFLDAHRNNPEQDRFSQYNRSLAGVCRGMVLHDVDGLIILHYLGKEFQKSVSQALHSDLYSRARTFIGEQIEQHRRSGNSKLAFRYSHLALYFDAHFPSGSENPVS
jgi:hypothetical protein